MSAFPDVKPFPASPPPATIGHNRPPLDEQVVIDLDEALAESGVKKRASEIIASAARAPRCDNDEIAGKVADLIKMSAATVKAIEAEREAINRPILTAQRALKGRADSLISDLNSAVSPLKVDLDRYAREQREEAARRQREAEAQARAAAEAAEAERQRQIAARGPSINDDLGEEEPAPAPVEIITPKIEAPVVRGDYGAKVGTKTVWKHEIDSVRQLPNDILNNEKVVEAINKVVAARIRGGTREIKGVRIWSEQETAVR